MEALALLGILLLLSSCTLCTAPDEARAHSDSGDGGGSRTKQWAGRLLALLSLVLAVSVCVCFFAQQLVFEAIGAAISDEELEDLLGDLHAIYCADHYSDGGGNASAAGNGTDGSWEATDNAAWESELDVDFEAGVGLNASAVNGTSLWGDERDCETMLSGNPMAHAGLGLRSWADLSPLVFAWLVCQSDLAALLLAYTLTHYGSTDECAHAGMQDTAGRWLVLLLGVTAARAVLLLKCSASRHGSGSQGVYVTLDSDQAGVM